MSFLYPLESRCNELPEVSVCQYAPVMQSDMRGFCGRHLCFEFDRFGLHASHLPEHCHRDCKAARTVRVETATRGFRVRLPNPNCHRTFFCKLLSFSHHDGDNNYWHFRLVSAVIYARIQGSHPSVSLFQTYFPTYSHNGPGTEKNLPGLQPWPEPRRPDVRESSPRSSKPPRK